MPNFGTPDLWEQRDAENWAAVYASTHGEVVQSGKDDEALRDALRRWLDLNNLDEVVDGETGLGVQLGKARRQTTWDTRNVDMDLLRVARDAGLLTIQTALFDNLVKSAPSSDLDALKRYRLDGETQRPVQVKTDA